MAYRTEGGEILVNTNITGSQSEAALTALSSGGFVVLWTGVDGGLQGEVGVKGQVFDAFGSKSGVEFLANQETSRFQYAPTVTALASGGFMGFWRQSGLNISYYEGRVFNADGSGGGGEFQPDSGYSRVGELQAETLSSGNVAVVWEADWVNSLGEIDGSYSGIRVQIHSPTGSVVTPYFFANSTTAGPQSDASVAALPGGGFIVAWTDGRTYDTGDTIGGDGSNSGVRAQLFDNAGAKIGPEFLVNSATANAQSKPAITVLAGGGFVIVWQDASTVGGDASGFAIKAQVFDATGAKVGSEILVNTVTAGDQIDPAIVALSSGGFLVAWSDNSGQGGDASGYGIKAQEFTSAGARVGGELLVNTATSGNQTDPVLEVLSGDRVVIAWTDASGTGGDNSGTSIKAQLLAPSAGQINGTAAAETINGTAGGDVISGLGGDDTINAGDGNDEIDGGTGADTMNGGGGNDIYAVDDVGDIVNENSGQGSLDEVRTVLETYQIGANIERLTGTSTTSGQRLLGNTLDNVIIGSGQRDRLEGGSGADVLIGSAGDDGFVVDSLDDQVFESAGEGTDTVFSFGDYVLTPGSDIEYLSSVDHGASTPMRLVGNELNNQIYGNIGSNRLEGGGGFDVLRGLAGDDTYVVDLTNDLIIEFVGDGTDTVLAMGSYVLNAGTEVEIVASIDADQTTAMRLVGNEFDNQIYGNAGRNRLEGGGGADLLQGYGGDDGYVVDSQSDIILEAVNGGTDTVFSFGDYSLASGVEVEYLSAVDHGAMTNIRLSGNAFSNRIYGNAGDNVIDGGAGADTLLGFGGSDTFSFTTALGSGNIDVIADFALGSERIALDDAVFTGLGLGALAPNAFRSGTTSADGDDRIIYNPETGALLFDPDGTGAAEAVQFAILAPGLANLGAEHFLVI